MPRPLDDLEAAAFARLAELDSGDGVPLTRLAKQLDLRVSVLMRTFTMLSDAVLGGVAGPGLVGLAEEDGRWRAWMTPAGRSFAGGHGQIGHAGESRGAPGGADPDFRRDDGGGRDDGVGRDDTPSIAPTRTVTVVRNGTTPADDTVAVETPVALVFNGISHAVMMATPADLEAFALGFALSEGLLRSRAECYGIDVIVGVAGIEVRLDVATAAEVRLKDQRRSLAGRTGCGLCGIDSLTRLDLVPERVGTPDWVADLTPAVVQRALAGMAGRQPINAATGACHAAAWADRHGEVLDVAEDVGRHNALDKLLGRRAAAGLSNADGFVVMSSRASYELVRKCARLGVPALATISAPTSLAIDIAREAGLVLYGFVRPGQAVRYTGPAG